MMHYCHMAEWIGMSFECDLRDLPAFAEDQIVKGINRRDPYFVGDRGKD